MYQHMFIKCNKCAAPIQDANNGKYGRGCVGVKVYGNSLFLFNFSVNVKLL